MIKNYNILREVELDLQASTQITPEKGISMMNDMLLFSKKFNSECLTSPEKTPHVKMLIDMVTMFRTIRTKIND